MSNDSNFLVLGTAIGYEPKDLLPFVTSLRRFYSGPAMLLVSSVGSEALVEYLRSQEITAVYFDCPRWMVMHFQLGRFVRYGEILRSCDPTYDRILLTDVFDVLFQSHPFATAPAGDLLCYLEHDSSTIGQSKSNALWVEQIFGPAELERLKDRAISCSGTILGSHAAIVGYIDLLLSYADPKTLAGLSAFRGHDQAIHNFLLHRGALPHAQVIPNGEHVYTLGTVPAHEILLGQRGTLLTPSGRLCPIIHQYQYHQFTLDHLAAGFHEHLEWPGDV